MELLANLATHALVVGFVTSIFLSIIGSVTAGRGRS